MLRHKGVNRRQPVLDLSTLVRRNPVIYEERQQRNTKKEQLRV